MAQKIPDWVWVGVLAGAGYAAYKFFGERKNYVEDKAAQTYLNIEDLFTGYTPVQGTLAGAVLFPNGAQVPMTNLTVTPYNGPDGFEARVVYQGKTYRLSPHDANGNYAASAI